MIFFWYEPKSGTEELPGDPVKSTGGPEESQSGPDESQSGPDKPSSGPNELYITLAQTNLAVAHVNL